MSSTFALEAIGSEPVTIAALAAVERLEVEYVMAVRLEGTIKRFIGLSSDRKPGEDPIPVGGESAPPAGSTFFESDTGAIFRYDNGGWRIPESKGDQTDALLRLIVAELQRIHIHLQLADGLQTEDISVH